MVADDIARWLDEKGISHAFGIIGGGNVVLWDAICRLGRTDIVCVHHEQAAAMAASYYFRSSGRLAVALVTTGAGSTNAITGVMAAYMDRTPLLVISGNEASGYFDVLDRPRVYGVQGYRSADLANGFTKGGWMVERHMSALATLENARNLALHPPAGPVWVDIPKDIQSAE